MNEVWIVKGIAKAYDTGSSEDWEACAPAATELAAYRLAYRIIAEYNDERWEGNDEELVEFLRLREAGKHEEAISFYNEKVGCLKVTLQLDTVSEEENCSNVDFSYLVDNEDDEDQDNGFTVIGDDSD